MNPTSFMKEIPTGSPSYQRRNPHLFPDQTPINLHGKWGFKVRAREMRLGHQLTSDAKPPKRLRQSSKPLMNNLESEWVSLLILEHTQRIIHTQSITFRLCNGLRYTPDAFSFEWPALGEADGPTAWEVKGKWVDGDSFPKLKMFAHQYPEIRVILAWKEKSGQWLTQRILA